MAWSGAGGAAPSAGAAGVSVTAVIGCPLFLISLQPGWPRVLSSDRGPVVTFRYIPHFQAQTVTAFVPVPGMEAVPSYRRSPRSARFDLDRRPSKAAIRSGEGAVIRSRRYRRAVSGLGQRGHRDVRPADGVEKQQHALGVLQPAGLGVSLERL